MLKRKENKHVDIAALGRFILRTSSGVNSWETFYELDTNRIELSIETTTDQPPTYEQIGEVVTFLLSCKELERKLLLEVYNDYSKTEYAKQFDEISKMYYLTAVTLKSNGEWWVVLEPGNVSSVYNHFKRFTISEGEVVWSSF